MWIRRVPRPLALLLVVAAVEVAAWTVFAAPLQGPDEIVHFDYTQQLAETWQPPERGFPEGTNGPDSREAGNAIHSFNLRTLVGIAEARPFWSDADQRRWAELERSLGPEARKDGKGPNAVSQNPPLYYGLQGNLPYRAAQEAPFFDRLFLMRITNGLLLLAAVVFTWLLAGELFGRVRWLQTLAAGAVALLPQLAYLDSTINPDTMLATVACAFAWAVARLLKRGPSPGRLALVVALTGVSPLTHGRGFALVLPGLAALALALWRHRAPLRRVLATAAATVLALGAAVGVGLIVTSQSGGGAAYGGEASLTAGASGFSVPQFLSYIWQFYLPKLWFMEPSISPPYGFSDVYVDTFFGTFASLEIRYPVWVYDLLQALVVVGLVALAVALATRREWLRRWDIALVFALMFVTLVGLLHFVAYRDLLKVPGDPILVGRYLLPLTSLFAIGLAYVARALPRRAGLALAAAVFLGGALLHLAGIGITGARFYG